VDPVTLLINITSLVQMWIGEQRFKTNEVHQSASEARDRFLQWLVKNNHRDVVAQLEATQGGIDALDRLLRHSHNEILAELKKLQEGVASLLQANELTRQLTIAAVPNSIDLRQAIGILRQFNEQDASKILQSNTIGRRSWLFVDGKGGELRIEDPRFLTSDLEWLVSCGLLIPGCNSKGTPTYDITRAGAKFGAAGG
jgi:hypothetical protein